MSEEFLIFYDVGAVLGFSLLIFMLISGGKSMRERAKKREFTPLGDYESIVAYGMFFGAFVLIVILCLVLIAMFSSR